MSADSQEEKEAEVLMERLTEIAQQPPSDDQADAIRELFGMKAQSDDPNSQSPCGQCLGYECGCMIAGERVPSEECATFYDKSKPIVIEYAEPEEKETA